MLSLNTLDMTHSCPSLSRMLQETPKIQGVKEDYRLQVLASTTLLQHSDQVGQLPRLTDTC